MTRKQRRLTLIGAALATSGVSVGLVMFALSSNIVYFLGPTELAQKAVAPGTRLRIGGLVKEGSVVRSPGSAISFAITDKVSDVAVSYTGLVPDLFREGQGVIAEGILQTGNRFAADSVLAKHDENYMPRDVADALKKQGVWKGGAAK